MFLVSDKRFVEPEDRASECVCALLLFICFSAAYQLARQHHIVVNIKMGFVESFVLYLKPKEKKRSRLRLAIASKWNAWNSSDINNGDHVYVFCLCLW